jgi:hypothetical protein
VIQRGRSDRTSVHLKNGGPGFYPTSPLSGRSPFHEEEIVPTAPLFGPFSAVQSFIFEYSHQGLDQ